jgi:hypothetical protein
MTGDRRSRRSGGDAAGHRPGHRPGAHTSARAGASAGAGTSAGGHVLAGAALLAGVAFLVLAISLAVSVALSACDHQGGAPRSAGQARHAAALAFCPTRKAALLAADLTRTVPDSGRTEVIPLGAAPSGRVAYAAVWTPAFSGVAAVDLATGRLRPISAFPDPAEDQADGASSGRWLVWAQTDSLSNLDTFKIFAWNAATGRLRQLGHSLSGPGGIAWPSPWHAPAVGGNYAAWAQGYGPGGLVEIRLANLLTGKVTTIRRGHVQPPFFDRDLVVWPESDTPGSETALHAYSLRSAAPARLPAVLAAVHGTDFVVTDGTRTAYLSPDFTALYYSPAQGQVARQALRLPVGVDFTDLAIAPGVLAWSTTSATYLASTRTGAFAQVTPEFGYATGSGSVVLVTDPPEEKTAHPALPTHVIDPQAVDWSACARPRR